MGKKPDPEMIDDENPEWTEETFATARPAREVLSELFGPERTEAFFAANKRGRPPVETPKQPIHIRLSGEVLSRFRATGPGWQTRIDKALQAWLQEHDPARL
ncbi:MAG: BrnA antitoxin family protein [Magnetococcales bacterium]|nr:BrnA antitoxin family protein [Magnetococcales bacterium]